MSREIKFRGLSIQNREWVYGDLVVNRPTKSYRIFTDFANVKHGSFTESGLHECSGQLVIVDPETVGEYTGLKDKSGKEIYEGDIFKTESGTVFSVGWNKLQHRWSCYNKNDDCRFHLNEGEEIEVIGNIHQNPELLNPSPSN